MEYQEDQKRSHQACVNHLPNLINSAFLCIIFQLRQDLKTNGTKTLLLLVCLIMISSLMSLMIFPWKHSSNSYFKVVANLLKEEKTFDKCRGFNVLVYQTATCGCFCVRNQLHFRFLLEQVLNWFDHKLFQFKKFICQGIVASIKLSFVKIVKYFNSFSSSSRCLELEYCWEHRHLIYKQVCANILMIL